MPKFSVGQIVEVNTEGWQFDAAVERFDTIPYHNNGHIGVKVLTGPFKGNAIWVPEHHMRLKGSAFAA